MDFLTDNCRWLHAKSGLKWKETRNSDIALIWDKLLSIQLQLHPHKTATRPLILICNACLNYVGCPRLHCFEAFPLWPLLNRELYGLFYLAVRKLGIAWSSSVSICLFMQASPPFINVGHIYKCSNMCYSVDDSKDCWAASKPQKAKLHSFGCCSDCLLNRSLYNIGLILFQPELLFVEKKTVQLLLSFHLILLFVKFDLHPITINIFQRLHPLF